jgi:uncharacterized protein
MTENKQTVSNYMEAYEQGGNERILSCLTDDVEWDVPGAFHVFGKEAFEKEIRSDCFVGDPKITINRLIEENDVVIAEGTVLTELEEGGPINIKYCDVFELIDGKISKLTSYLMTMADQS